MRNAKLFLGVIMVSSIFLVGFGLPKNIEKRVHKELEKTFQFSEFLLHPIAVSESLNAQLPKKINVNNLFKISHDADHLGYVFVGQAPSKTAMFDYLIVFDKELRVMHSKVLIYREEYGGEIGSKRWLKQFLGKTGGDRVNHESNIDGIAGATISVRSMTTSIDSLLLTIEILQKNKVL